MNSIEFEIFIDFFLDDNRLLKDRFMILLSNCCELNFFVIKTSIINDYVHQDLRKSLIEIMFEQLKYSLCIENMFEHQALIARSNNVER